MLFRSFLVDRGLTAAELIPFIAEIRSDSLTEAQLNELKATLGQVVNDNTIQQISSGNE